jgi:hypothetical protein
MALSINHWLEGIQLDVYTQNFESSGYFDLSQCVSLTEENLDAIGVSPLGHRKRILAHLPDADVVLGLVPPPPPRQLGQCDYVNLPQEDEYANVQDLKRNAPDLPPKTNLPALALRPVPAPRYRKSRAGSDIKEFEQSAGSPTEDNANGHRKRPVPQPRIRMLPGMKQELTDSSAGSTDSLADSKNSQHFGKSELLASGDDVGCDSPKPVRDTDSTDIEIASPHEMNIFKIGQASEDTTESDFLGRLAEIEKQISDDLLGLEEQSNDDSLEKQSSDDSDADGLEQPKTAVSVAALSGKAEFKTLVSPDRWKDLTEGGHDIFSTPVPLPPSFDRMGDSQMSYDVPKSAETQSTYGNGAPPKIRPSYDIPSAPVPVQPSYDLPAPPVPVQPSYDLPAPPALVQPSYNVLAPPAPVQPSFDAPVPTPAVPVQPSYDVPAPPAPVQPSYDVPVPAVPVQPSYDVPALHLPTRIKGEEESLDQTYDVPTRESDIYEPIWNATSQSEQESNWDQTKTHSLPSNNSPDLSVGASQNSASNTLPPGFHDNFLPNSGLHSIPNTGPNSFPPPCSNHGPSLLDFSPPVRNFEPSLPEVPKVPPMPAELSQFDPLQDVDTTCIRSARPLENIRQDEEEGEIYDSPPPSFAPPSLPVRRQPPPVPQRKTESPEIIPETLGEISVIVENDYIEGSFDEFSKLRAESTTSSVSSRSSMPPHPPPPVPLLTSPTTIPTRKTPPLPIVEEYHKLDHDPFSEAPPKQQPFKFAPVMPVSSSPKGFSRFDSDDELGGEFLCFIITLVLSHIFSVLC